MGTSETSIRSLVDGGSSVFGVSGFMPVSSVGVFTMFDRLPLIDFRFASDLIFTYQAAVRGCNLNRTIREWWLEGVNNPGTEGQAPKLEQW